MSEEIIKLIDNIGLSQIKDKLIKEAKVSIRMNTKVVDEEEIDLGASKIGGLPHLPKDIKWINNEEVPLSFIAQINMRDTMPHDVEKILPKSGIIYFFYDCEKQPWGFDPKDCNGWKVLYFKGDTSELICKEPPDDLIVFDVCAISFSSEFTLPPWDSEYIKKLSLNQSEEDLYYDLIEEIEKLYKEGDERINRILGHPNAIQGDMQIECQLVTNGLYCGNLEAYYDPRRFELEKGASDWILLFQIDSDENSAMMWGDDGKIYYWIKKQDLLRYNFENTWLILQSG